MIGFHLNFCFFFFTVVVTAFVHFSKFKFIVCWKLILPNSNVVIGAHKLQLLMKCWDADEEEVGIGSGAKELMISGEPIKRSICNNCSVVVAFKSHWVWRLRWGASFIEVDNIQSGSRTRANDNKQTELLVPGYLSPIKFYPPHFTCVEVCAPQAIHSVQLLYYAVVLVAV